METLTRRIFCLGAAGMATTALAGCTTNPGFEPATPLQRPDILNYAQIYGPQLDEAFPLPAIPYKKIDHRFYRQMVRDPTGERPGTLVVDTANHFLYLTYRNGQAMRYGVGLGRAGFDWSGRGVIQYRRQWPRWTPPDEMVARQPELEPYSIANGGMEPGLKNPLGARALYIFQNGQDTLYRIHGSPEWWSIGKSVSSGCVRMLNHDVIDLYDRVSDDAPIIVTGLISGPMEDSSEGAALVQT
ncbi:MAG: L,D-transpeptidase [Alphaproteobacteria bacterium]|nr:L,D-transpeptidase [Alphaproteobacteria bacterium]MBU1552119.1 L,D-transpeptidase [Alphaproteobacteria bacterium]MBU2336356.1 L,D-transpeptidase [Alphaproteobacteria bacterium]MBU2388201.1 L,D-transpeptidase [Alphaproteobacteria bacterium]